MYDPEFLNTSQGPAKADRPPEQKAQPRPWGKGNSLRASPLKLNETKEIEVGGKEEVWASLMNFCFV